MKKLMLIDSDIAHLRGMSGVLSKDFSVLICSRWNKAWELFDIFAPDALILDPTSADSAAPVFLHHLRAKICSKPIPVIVLSRLASLKHIETSLDWGADLVFSKPCQGARLQKKLLELFSNRETPVELIPV
jgi:DNA-binding response OmpR family regulator